MAVIQAHTGEVQIADTAIGHIESFTYRTNQPPFKYGELGDINLKSVAGARDNTGNVQGYSDETDAQQTAILTASENGTSVTLGIFPAGDSSGNFQYVGSVVISNLEISGRHGDLVRFSFDFDGELTRGTVA